MRYWIYICFAWISVGCSVAQFNPEPKKVTDMYFPDVESIQNVTPALKKKKGLHQL